MLIFTQRWNVESVKSLRNKTRDVANFESTMLQFRASKFLSLFFPKRLQQSCGFYTPDIEDASPFVLCQALIELLTTAHDSSLRFCKFYSVNSSSTAKSDYVFDTYVKNPVKR